MQSSESFREKIAGVLFGTGAALIWGGFPVISRLGLRESLDALDITAIRYLVAGLLLAPVLLARGLRGVPLPAVLILVWGAGAPYLLLAAGGLALAPANHFGVIGPSCMLLATALGSRILNGEVLSPLRVVGMAVIIAGIVLIGIEGFAADESGVLFGDLLFVGAGFSWAAFTLATRHYRVEPFHAISIVAVFSLIAFAPFYLFLAGDRLLSAPRDEILLQAVFQGVLSAFIALWLYTRTVSILGATRGALFAALVPGFALLLAIPLLGEIPTWLQLAGVGLVTAGMVLALGVIDRMRRK